MKIPFTVECCGEQKQHSPNPWKEGEPRISCVKIHTCIVSRDQSIGSSVSNWPGAASAWLRHAKSHTRHSHRLHQQPAFLRFKMLASACCLWWHTSGDSKSWCACVCVYVVMCSAYMCKDTASHIETHMSWHFQSFYSLENLEGEFQRSLEALGFLAKDQRYKWSAI